MVENSSFSRRTLPLEGNSSNPARDNNKKLNWFMKKCSSVFWLVPLNMAPNPPISSLWNLSLYDCGFVISLCLMYVVKSVHFSLMFGNYHDAFIFICLQVIEWKVLPCQSEANAVICKSTKWIHWVVYIYIFRHSKMNHSIFTHWQSSSQTSPPLSQAPWSWFL